MRLSDAGLRRRRTNALYPNHRLPPWPAEDAASRSLEPIVRGRLRTTVKSKYDTLAYTPIPSAVLHRSMPLRKASPAHILLPSGRQGRRGLNTRKGHAMMDATFGQPRNATNPAIGRDNMNIVVPSASDAATLRRCVIGPLTIRLSDAGMHCRPTKLFYFNHRLPPWLTEGATRDRSNRLLDYRAAPASKLPFNGADELTPSLARRKDLKALSCGPALNGGCVILRQRQRTMRKAAAPIRTPLRPCHRNSRRSRADLEAEAREAKGAFNRVLPVNPRTSQVLRSR